MAVSPEAPPRAPRESTFDILKGVSILEVVAHHVLSSSMRKYAVPHTDAWWAMAALSRILHFAVPTFLLVSALLLARSVASRPQTDWRRFYTRRVQRSLAPYLIWSVIYLVFRRMVIGETPEFLQPMRLAEILLMGKAYFHLYFLVVLLQFALVFPVLLAWVRKSRLSFVGAVAAALCVQVGVFLIHGRLFTLTYPASTILWYCAPILVGIWLGVHWSAWPQIWERHKMGILVGSAVGLATYLPLALAIYDNRPIASLPYNTGFIVYAVGVALTLLAVSPSLAKRPGVERVLRHFGENSLQYFLLHPIALYLLGGPRLTALFAALPLAPVFFGAAVLGATGAMVVALRLLRLERWLFAR